MSSNLFRIFWYRLVIDSALAKMLAKDGTKAKKDAYQWYQGVTFNGYWLTNHCFGAKHLLNFLESCFGHTIYFCHDKPPPDVI